MNAHNFPLGVNSYHKLPFFSRFVVRKSLDGIWREGADLGLLPHAKFSKNHLREYTSLGKIYTKNTNFGDFGGCKPTF